MNLYFNRSLIANYKSSAQIARVLTENWVKTNCYCPKCGNPTLENYSNNKPVADFYCDKCKEDYELKSKSGKLGNKITDGAYSKMIERIECNNNPNFFFLDYNRQELSVKNFIIIPKQLFIPQIIEKRKPLSLNAKRAGWVGCNIDVSRLPEIGKVYIVKDSNVVTKDKVISDFNKTLPLNNKSLKEKGWTMSILRCIDKIKSNSFSLNDIYAFENELKVLYPHNKFIRDKIRQQLQVLRDMGVIEFKTKGNYIKVL
jgi:type II restriction enzyme